MSQQSNNPSPPIPGSSVACPLVVDFRSLIDNSEVLMYQLSERIVVLRGGTDEVLTALGWKQLHLIIDLPGLPRQTTRICTTVPSTRQIGDRSAIAYWVSQALFRLLKEKLGIDTTNRADQWVQIGSTGICLGQIIVQGLVCVERDCVVRLKIGPWPAFTGRCY